MRDWQVGDIFTINQTENPGNNSRGEILNIEKGSTVTKYTVRWILEPDGTPSPRECIFTYPVLYEDQLSWVLYKEINEIRLPGDFGVYDTDRKLVSCYHEPEQKELQLFTSTTTITICKKCGMELK